MFAGSYRALLQTSCSLALILGMTASAKAELSISNKPTQNVTCNAGICAATAMKAVLNVTDLGDMLTTTDITIKSGNLARDIVFDTAFSWTSGNGMALDAFRSIEFGKAVSVAGSGGVSLIVNDGGSGGTLSFIKKGSLTFLSTANNLTINGLAYTLVNSLPELISAHAANPAGVFALANNYDAAIDGVYTSSILGGVNILEGLGHAISHLKIVDDARLATVAFIASGGTVSNFSLTDVYVEGGISANVGGLAGQAGPLLFNDHVSGTIKGGGNSQTGGLVGWNLGTIAQSSSSAKVYGQKKAAVGGLVGENKGTISGSFATGDVRQIDKQATRGAQVGGLVGINDGSTGGAVIENSYATGSVAAEGRALTGGLIGLDQSGVVTTSYSTGAISTGNGGLAGGFIGGWSGGTLTDNYWDIETSGTDQGVGGGNVDGVTGLTTAQLLSNLPSGFDAKIWAQSPMINNGYPYLIANPPAK